MITHFVFSPGGESLKIAKYCQEKLGGNIVNLTDFKIRTQFDFSITFKHAFFYFPVYSQNIPRPLRTFFKQVKVRFYVLNITFGRMSHGNVLWETHMILKKYGSLLGGTYIPTKHSYLKEEYVIDFGVLDPIIEKIIQNDLKTIAVPKLRKNILSSFFEKQRTNFNYRIKVEKGFETFIGSCPVQAINSQGIDKKRCIKCARCTTYSKSFIGTRSRLLVRYLKTKEIHLATTYY